MKQSLCREKNLFPLFLRSDDAAPCPLPRFLRGGDPLLSLLSLTTSALGAAGNGPRSGGGTPLGRTGGNGSSLRRVFVALTPQYRTNVAIRICYVVLLQEIQSRTTRARYYNVFSYCAISDVDGIFSIFLGLTGQA